MRVRFKRLTRVLSTVLALVAVFAVVTSASAGRAWCRADPVLIVNGDVVDIQVASSLQMFGSATGPIEMVVYVERGTRANVILEDFGFGYGYDTRIEEVRKLDRGVRARVEVRAPATDSALPVAVHGTRVGSNISWLFSGQLDLLWLDSAEGSANEWIVLNVR